MTSEQLAALLTPLVEAAVKQGLPEAMTEKVLWVVERRSNRKRPFRRVYPSDQEFLAAVRRAQLPALELALAFAPVLDASASEVPYQVLAKAESRAMQDAALEGIASMGDKRAFCALVEHDSPRARTLYSGRVFEGALPLVEQRVEQELVVRATKDPSAMEPAKRVRLQSLLTHLARHPKTRCRELVFAAFEAHSEPEIRYTAAAVLFRWADEQSTQALVAMIDDSDAYFQSVAMQALFRTDPTAVYDHFGGDALRESKDFALVDRLLTVVGRDRDRKGRSEPIGIIEGDPRWLTLALIRKKDRKVRVREGALYVLESSPPELVAAAEAALATETR